MLRMDIDLVLPHIPFVDVGRCRSSRSATTSIMIGRCPDGSDWLAFDKCLYSLDECSGGSICRIVRIPPACLATPPFATVPILRGQHECIFGECPSPERPDLILVVLGGRVTPLKCWRWRYSRAPRYQPTTTRGSLPSSGAVQTMSIPSTNSSCLPEPRFWMRTCRSNSPLIVSKRRKRTRHRLQQSCILPRNNPAYSEMPRHREAGHPRSARRSRSSTQHCRTK